MSKQRQLLTIRHDVIEDDNPAEYGGFTFILYTNLMTVIC